MLQGQIFFPSLSDADKIHFLAFPVDVECVLHARPSLAQILRCKTWEVFQRQFSHTRSHDDKHSCSLNPKPSLMHSAPRHRTVHACSDLKNNLEDLTRLTTEGKGEAFSMSSRLSHTHTWSLLSADLFLWKLILACLMTRCASTVAEDCQAGSVTWKHVICCGYNDAPLL
jgi:hypothetical protein